MSRADPPFECAGQTPTQRITQARHVLTQFRPHDINGSLADLYDALHQGEQTHE
jgi:hypothetical protein